MLIFETRLSIYSTWKNGFFFSYATIVTEWKKVENSEKSLIWNQWIPFHFLITSNVIAFYMSYHFKSAYQREKMLILQRKWISSLSTSNQDSILGIKKVFCKMSTTNKKISFSLIFVFFSLFSEFFFHFPKRKGDMIRSIIYFRYFSSMNGIFSCWNKKMTKI